MPKTKQALIVENNEALATELQSLLEEVGYKVTTIQDPQQVARTLEGREYEVALMNMTLPGMTWRRSLHTVKSAARTTTVIMVQQSPSEDDVRLALNAGAYVVMDRPLTQAQLAGLISPQNDGLFVALRG